MDPKSQDGKPKGLLERLKSGVVICAEGYLFELERRGYLSAGAFVPEVVLEHPEVVKQLHTEFVRAGSDVVEALTYYANREKLRLIGKEHMLEDMNRKALRIAKEVAVENGCLMAGNICNTNIYHDKDEASAKLVRDMFDEQVKWAVEEGCDYVIAETISWLGEALIAVEVIKKYNIPAVVTLTVPKDGKLSDGSLVEDACIALEKAGADVVGVNCFRGPDTINELLEKIIKVVKIPVAALPVPFRTTKEQPTFFSLTDPKMGNERAFPLCLDPFTCNRHEISEWAKTANSMGVKYIGLCCGAGPHHVRALSEALGRNTVANRYCPDMSKHFALGTHEKLKKHNIESKDRL